MAAISAYICMYNHLSRYSETIKLNPIAVEPAFVNIAEGMVLSLEAKFLCGEDMDSNPVGKLFNAQTYKFMSFIVCSLH